ncbi:MAG: Glycerol kinase [Thelocarpon superellum]|nr:MAG: Glycerol kinase [Thelocarpon superellum]
MADSTAASLGSSSGGPKDSKDAETKTSPESHVALQRWFIGSIDQGTTSSRFLIFDGTGTPVASHQVEFKQMYPHPGWHEHDPMELVSSVEACVAKATEDFVRLGHDVSEIKAIGITNQRETTVLWDTHTGEPLCNAIVWPDTRTTGLVRELKDRPRAAGLQDQCGLPLSTYPSSVKVLWLLRHDEQVRKAYEEARLSFGTVDTWLLYRLNGATERDVHVTDATNASRTMFLNLYSLQYDDALLDFFQLQRSKIRLPRVVPSSDSDAFGAMAAGPLRGVKITGCLGDQSSALVGQCALAPGLAKNTYGTGCFLLYNVGEEPVISQHGLLATVAYAWGGERKPVYALEGSIAVAGSGVQFLRTNLGFIEESAQISELAATVPDNGGVVFVTAFSGLFAPYWIDDAKGTIFGITQHTQRGHIARATLEATCFQTKAILDAMEKDSGHRLRALAVDGGMSNSDLCMQTQADLIGIPVDRPAMRETTALGAAIAAGFAIDMWKELDELKEINRSDRTIFQPAMPPHTRDDKFRRWERAVEMAKGWVEASEKAAPDSSSCTS